ncbi:hypothetical protein [Nocardioides sp. zg-DK7169]|uniref:hypothetical protein n=1 Tax=Nocardioides sp. zg-DK7169 TaxID=2736600 RepID=UPI0015581B50|nr:hypothetical protein [Nocardioides sp. zg-DK7169]NPC98088.1 hypothetical protein [Nocardioides sp. zg-DK7169]
MHSRRLPARRRRLRAVLPALLVIGAPLAGTAPAAAHPFGDPQQLSVEASAQGVEITWRAAEDDLTSLALRLDVLAGPRAYVLRGGAMVPETSDADDARLLAESPRLAGYLLSRLEVGVGEDGVTPCEGALVSAEDLATRGARLAFTCPGTTAPDAVTVRARLLTDLHAAYRTLATGPGGATAVFSAEADTHELVLRGPATGNDAAAGGLALVGWAAGGGGVLGIGLLAVRRLRGRAS